MIYLLGHGDDTKRALGSGVQFLGETKIALKYCGTGL